MPTKTDSQSEAKHDIQSGRPFFALDPVLLLEVRRRRVLAFIADLFAIGFFILIAAIVVLFAGIVTFGLAWLTYFILPALVGLIYIGFGLGGPFQATFGMRLFSIRLERVDGRGFDFWSAVIYAILFWLGHITLTPFLLLVSLFTRNKELAQDLLMGTVVVRSDIQV